METHQLEAGNWKAGKPTVRKSWMEEIYDTLGRRFPLYWRNRKFSHMEGDFTVAEKATIKAILEDHGMI